MSGTGRPRPKRHTPKPGDPPYIMPPDEAAVVAGCDKWARTFRYHIDDYSDTRKVKTSPGLADRRYWHERGPRIWVETKAPGGLIRSKQVAFLRSELAAGALAVVIDDPETLRALFADMTRNSSIVDSALRDRCRQIVELFGRRRFKDETAAEHAARCAGKAVPS